MGLNMMNDTYGTKLLIRARECSAAPVGGWTGFCSRTQGSLRVTLGFIPSPPPETGNETCRLSVP